MQNTSKRADLVYDIVVEKCIAIVSLETINGISKSGSDSCRLLSTLNYVVIVFWRYFKDVYAIESKMFKKYFKCVMGWNSPQI